MLTSHLIAVLVLYLNYQNVNASPLKVDKNLSCQACHKLVKGKINVHLVPHSHDDVGWLRTFSQYYYGKNAFDDYGKAGVQNIISSTVQALKANPDRRFIQVETAFFWEWWLHQDNCTKQDVIDLVNSGQLEMTNGAWSMNDEAAVHYQSVIDQFTWGFRILNNTVGTCGEPKIGWQIDPFGHSREHASLVKQFGFEGLVIGRLDYRDKSRRIIDRSLDFIWKSSNNLDNSKLFTTMFPSFYADENGYKFDVMNGDVITDKNLEQKVKGFANILNHYSTFYKTPNIMMPMGNDFTYQRAEINFKYMDKLIKGFENHSIYNVFYSTPSCYIQAVQNEVKAKNISLEVKTDDFFPYASSSYSYWTGYFTSRPNAKRFERIGNNILQSLKQLTTFSRIKNKEYDIDTLDLRQTMGVLQHHDSITGTAKQAVANDYAKMLHRSIIKTEKALSSIIMDLLNVKDLDVNLNFSFCLMANVSVCANSQKEQFVVAVQNPLSRSITHYVRLPVDGDSYRITGPDGDEIYDIFDTIHSFDHLKNHEKVSQKKLVFAARNLPPLGIKLYYIVKLNSLHSQYKPFKNITSDNLVFGTQVNGFTINSTTMTVNSVTIRGMTEEISQDFGYYTTSSSGAYLFRPLETEAIRMTNKTEAKFVKGHLADEVIQTVNDEVTQIVRVYKGSDDAYIEFDWLVGNLQYVGGRGKEVITKYTIKNFSNDNLFYTDSNGREIIQRVLNNRSDYIYDPTDHPVASNYYPITSKIQIKDESKKLQLAILNDRSQGGSSLKNGEIELMLHRKLTMDDGLGVGEVLDEKEYGLGMYARGQHILTFGSSLDVQDDKSESVFERDLAQRKLLAPLIMIADASGKNLTLEQLQGSIDFTFQGLKTPLPVNVHLLTLEPWIDSYILRLEHILEKDEDGELSKPVTVNLKDLFTLFSITEAHETTLGANKRLEENSNLDDIITLNPMQIRTFIVKTDGNNIGGHADTAGEYSGGNKGCYFAPSQSIFFLLIVTLYLFR